MYLIKSLFSLILLSSVLVACKSKTFDDDDVIPSQKLYDDAISEFEAKKYKDASLSFERLFFQHPGKEITAQAELMQAYSLYLAGEYDEAVDVLEVFIKLHPRHQDIAYAYYLKAMSNYIQISDVQLDQSRTQNALSDLKEVMQKFPGSKYAIDSSLKIDLVYDHLAGKEMLVGRYYLKRKNPIAAIKRFQTVVNKYDTTSHTPEALYRLIESNLALGIVDEAKKYFAVISHNYPNTSWYRYSENLLK